MKQVLVIAAVALSSLYLTSCNKDNSVSPSSATTLTSNATAGTDSTGTRPPKPDSIAISSLPTSITTYITTNYAGATIKHAGKDKDGNYIVGILVNNQPKGLLFTSAGVFSKELPAPPKGGQGGGKGGPQPPQLTEVAVTSLSSAITSYVSTNYAGATILKAGTDKDGNFVILLSTNKGLLFTSAGVFTKELPAPPKKG